MIGVADDVGIRGTGLAIPLCVFIYAELDRRPAICAGEAHGGKSTVVCLEAAQVGEGRCLDRSHTAREYPVAALRLTAGFVAAGSDVGASCLSERVDHV